MCKSAQSSPWQGCRFVRSGSSSFFTEAGSVDSQRYGDYLQLEQELRGCHREGHRSRSQDTQERRGRPNQGQKIIVKNGKIAEYRVDLKVTFILID
jgi:hypothetical protein